MKKQCCPHGRATSHARFLHTPFYGKIQKPYVSIDYLAGREKEKTIDISGLTEKETEIIEKLVEFFRENKKN